MIVSLSLCLTVFQHAAIAPPAPVTCALSVQVHHSQIAHNRLPYNASTAIVCRTTGPVVVTRVKHRHSTRCLYACACFVCACTRTLAQRVRVCVLPLVRRTHNLRSTKSIRCGQMHGTAFRICSAPRAWVHYRTHHTCLSLAHGNDIK